MITAHEQAERMEAIRKGLRVSDEDVTWRAMGLALEVFTEAQVDDALRPDIGNEARQFNAGRAAGMKDFRAWLEGVRLGKGVPDGLAQRR